MGLLLRKNAFRCELFSCGRFGRWVKRRPRLERTKWERHTNTTQNFPLFGFQDDRFVVLRDNAVELNIKLRHFSVYLARFSNRWVRICQGKSLSSARKTTMPTKTTVCLGVPNETAAGMKGERLSDPRVPAVGGCPQRYSWSRSRT